MNFYKLIGSKILLFFDFFAMATSKKIKKFSKYKVCNLKKKPKIL